MHKLSLTHEQLRERILEVHGDKYIYDTFCYKNNKDKLSITCPLHGKFEQVIHAHLRGAGCKVCAGAGRPRHTVGTFLKEAKNVHGSKYMYCGKLPSNKGRVTIVCPYHGDFNQRVCDHLSGRGCPSCGVSGYSVMKPGLLYILQDEDVTKIGITNQTAERRLAQVRKESGIPFKLLHTVRCADGKLVYETEQRFLKELRIHYRQPSGFAGSTECFMGINTEEIFDIKDRICGILGASVLS